jgi:hypothetical protein
MSKQLALVMQASMNAGGMTKGANEAAAACKKVGDAANKTAADVSVLKTLAIGAVVAKGIGMVARAFTSAASAAGNYAAGVAQSVDATNDLAQRLGISVEALQSLQMAAKLSGVDDISGALQKVTIAVGQAAEGSEAQTKAFQRLGLSIDDIMAMSPAEQFATIQQAIAGLPTPAERAAAAVALFGRSGVELLPLMNQNLEEVEERMRRLGAIVGEDQVEAIGGMNDALDMVKATFDGIIGQVVGNLAPVVESLANDLLAFVEEFNNIGGEGGGIANAISNALLDVADYFAGVFDNAIASLDGFGTTLSEVGSIFEFVGNVFTAVAETLRAGFNVFELAGNALALGLGKFLEGIGSWVSSDLEKFGRDMAANAEKQGEKNSQEMESAAAGAANAAGRAVFGGNASEGASGPASRAVASARSRMNDPAAKAERERQRQQRDYEAKAAREAAAVDAKAKRDAEEMANRQKKAAAVEKKVAGKQEDIDKIAAERTAALGGKSNEALKANDVRSSEGMAQFIALATGREDPAIAEYRKQTQKLDEIRGELRALQQEKVDILGAAA